MAAYLIANVDVKDAPAFEEYRKLVPATVERHGGRFLARGGRFESLEGAWQPRRLVVIEFPSLEQARRWYHSEEYRPALEIRLRAAVSDVVIVEGV